MRWRLSLIITLIILLLLGVILCVFFLVALPHIVQSIVDESDVEFLAMNMTEPYYAPPHQSVRLIARGIVFNNVHALLERNDSPVPIQVNFRPVSRF